MLLLHGWPQDRSAWRGVAPALAARFTVLSCDLPGVGDSTGEPGDQSKLGLARAIHAALTRNGVRPAFVAGHDIGGMIAYAYAATYPDEVKAVAIVEVTIPGTAPYRAIMPSPQGWYVRFHQTPDLPDAMIRGHEALYFGHFLRPFSRTPSAPSAADIDRYATAYATPARLLAAIGFYRSLPKDETDNARLLATPLPMPVLGVAGGGMGPASAARDMVSELGPRTRGESVPGAGHWLLDERPAEIGRLLVEFFSQPSTKE